MRGLMLFSLLAAAGCYELEACTEIGCGLPFQVNFVKASAWRPGSYTVEVETDRSPAPSACETQLPFGGCQIAVPCEGPAEDWRMGLSGCALPTDNHTITGVSFSSARPVMVKVSVFHDGRPIGTGTFTPTYTVSRPNGRNCEPECRTAPTASLALE
jgi:hypothetical protein